MRDLRLGWWLEIAGRAGVILSLGFLLWSAVGLAPAARAQDVQQIVLGESDDTDTYDPYTTRSGVTGKRIATLLYEPLLRVPDAAGETEMALADSFYIPPKTTGIVRVRLASDAKWHDGQPVTVDDVIFSYKTCQSPEFVSIISSDIRRFASLVVSITPMNEPGWMEFKIRQGLPGSPERYLILPIVPKHKFGAVAGKFTPCTDGQEAVGSGPVRLFSAKPGSHKLIFKIFEEHHGGGAKLEPRAQIIPDENAKILGLSGGGITFVPEVPPQYISQFHKQSQDYQVHVYPSYTFESIALNFDNDLIAKHKNLRKAMMHAIDRNGILETVYQQQGSEINGPFTPATACQCPDSDPYAFEPETSIKLLEADGFVRQPDNSLAFAGKKVKFRLIAWLPVQQSEKEKVIDSIKDNFQDIGIELEVKLFTDKKAWQSIVFDKEDFDMTLITWEYDPAGMIGDLFRSGAQRDPRTGKNPENLNFIDYSNPKVDAIIDAYEKSTDRFSRGENCKELDKILNDELPYLFLWTTKKNAVFNVQWQEFRNVRITPLTIFDTFESWYAVPK
jgi:peptide/nickel transport system substrate-binding protein